MMNKKPQAEKSVYINISLPPDASERIRRTCAGLDKTLSQFFREAAECYLEYLGASKSNIIFDPAAIAKAHGHMVAMRWYAEELQAVMKNVKNQCMKL